MGLTPCLADLPAGQSVTVTVFDLTVWTATWS